jgi:hypothetical protein
MWPLFYYSNLDGFSFYVNVLCEPHVSSMPSDPAATLCSTVAINPPTQRSPDILLVSPIRQKTMCYGYKKLIIKVVFISSYPSCLEKKSCTRVGVLYRQQVNFYDRVSRSGWLARETQGLY